MDEAVALNVHFSVDDPTVFAGAVRETVHRQILDLLERRGLITRVDLIACPQCGDRVILLDQPGTFVFDRQHDERICAACGAARDFIKLVEPEADFGGEGGA